MDGLALPGAGQPRRSQDELAAMAARVGRATHADALICTTEAGNLPRIVQDAAAEVRVVAATSSEATQQKLIEDGFQAVKLPALVADRYRQARLAIVTVFNSGALAEGDVVVCVVGHGTSLGQGDLVLVTDLDEVSAALVVTDLVRLTDGIRPRVLQTVLEVAGRIGQISRRGKSLGAVFVLGDSDRVLEGARQLVLNPFHGHREADRMVTNHDLQDTLVELAKLDGAFVLRGDGMIRSGGVFLSSTGSDVDVPAGLGARHVAAAAVTARSDATAVAVSATDGFIRVFAGGKLVMQMDPFTALVWPAS